MWNVSVCTNRAVITWSNLQLTCSKLPGSGVTLNTQLNQSEASWIYILMFRTNSGSMKRSLPHNSFHQFRLWNHGHAHSKVLFKVTPDNFLWFFASNCAKLYLKYANDASYMPFLQKIPLGNEIWPLLKSVQSYPHSLIIFFQIEFCMRSSRLWFG